MNKDIQFPGPIITDEGIVLVGQFIQCKRCNLTGLAYINMIHVDKEDKIHDLDCLVCNSQDLEMITYKLLTEIIEDDSQNEEGN